MTSQTSVKKLNDIEQTKTTWLELSRVKVSILLILWTLALQFENQNRIFKNKKWTFLFNSSVILEVFFIYIFKSVLKVSLVVFGESRYKNC
jgi:hypothetical protein